MTKKKRGLIVGVFKNEESLSFIKRTRMFNQTTRARLEQNTALLEHLAYNIAIGERNQLEDNKQVAQLLPYVIIKHPEADMYFAYQRMQGIGESRLVGKTSIGFGGHFDYADLESHLDGSGIVTSTALLNAIKAGAIRELDEECIFEEGLVLSTEQMGFAGLIYSEATEVDAVHLAIVLVVEANVADCKEEELRSLGWLTKDEITCGDFNLETWTGIAINEMLK